MRVVVLLLTNWTTSSAGGSSAYLVALSKALILPFCEIHVEAFLTEQSTIFGQLDLLVVLYLHGLLVLASVARRMLLTWPFCYRVLFALIRTFRYAQ